MSRPETINFQFKRYHSEALVLENDMVAQLPGLLITQFTVPSDEMNASSIGRLGLRFDFYDDWYSVLAFLDGDKHPTGHYLILIQTPLQRLDNIWHGCELLLRIDVHPDGSYIIEGDEEFCAAVDEGWMRIYMAANAREAMRKLCNMLDDGKLPPEVMDAVCG